MNKILNRPMFQNRPHYGPGGAAKFFNWLKKIFGVMYQIWKDFKPIVVIV